MLFDQGSELTFVSEDLVRRLQLKRTQASIPLSGIGGRYSGHTRGIVSLRLQSLHDSSESCEISAYILSKLTAKLPSFHVKNSIWPHLQGLQFADPDFLQPDYINLLIGADYYGFLIKPELIKGNLSSPIAQKSIFGWIVSGPVSAEANTTVTSGYHCSKDCELQDLITRFWTQEETNSNNQLSLTPDEKKCEEHYLRTYSRDNTGRYIVRLPLKLSVNDLGDSTKSAYQSLYRLSRRFVTDSMFQERYTEFMNEYKSLGHMSLVSEVDTIYRPVYYLPHHGVMKEQNRTTKLRVVFNGSSKTTSGLSLNDILLPGANLQGDIADVLMWIRLHRYLFSTDIVKMYRQINVHPEDQDLQRIFWFGQDQQRLSYRLTTVTYGLNCAPFLALRTLQQLVEDEGSRYPLAIPCLIKGRYMDDIFGGADTLEQAQEIQEQLIQLCMAGGFPLQKWASNDEKLRTNTSILQENPTTPIEIETSLIKILGIFWRPSTDSFHFTAQTTSTDKITKRTILSEIARIFDPLGFISPVTVRAKIILQELWLAKVGWDDLLPSEMSIRWRTFLQQLQDLHQLSIPRWLHFSTTAYSIELHGFSDASQLAMAAAIYFKVTTADGNSTVTLVSSKTKVAPLKKITIPRLELTAALLLARQINNVKRALELTEVTTYLWTDSSITLTWITSHPSRWKDYVCNRVNATQSR